MAALGQTNISTTLVGNTLGISTHNVSQLCTSDKINILSGRKPVKQPYSNVDGVQNWWKAANGNWGIKLPETGSSTALQEGMSQSQTVKTANWSTYGKVATR